MGYAEEIIKYGGHDMQYLLFNNYVFRIIVPRVWYWCQILVFYNGNHQICFGCHLGSQPSPVEKEEFIMAAERCDL